MVYKDEYPEHLKHLYLAEAEKMRNEARANRVNRSKLRMKGKMEEDVDEEEYDDETAVNEKTDLAEGSELTDSVSENPKPTTASDRER